MKIRKLILNGEEQYAHTLPMVNMNNLPEDAQDGEMFFAMNGGLILLIYKDGTWWYTRLSELTEK